MTWENDFASVRTSKSHNVLYLTVKKEKASDGEFRQLIESTEREYTAMPPNFVLILDMTHMGLLPLHQAGMWMEMFQRALPVTKANLVQTCICFSNELVKFAVDSFLLLYHPVKPFYTFATRADCVSAAKLRLEEDRYHATTNSHPLTEPQNQTCRRPSSPL